MLSEVSDKKKSTSVSIHSILPILKAHDKVCTLLKGNTLREFISQA